MHWPDWHCNGWQGIVGGWSEAALNERPEAMWDVAGIRSALSIRSLRGTPLARLASALLKGGQCVSRTCPRGRCLAIARKTDLLTTARLHGRKPVQRCQWRAYQWQDATFSA